MRDFTVYEKLIRKSSEFFDNALKGPWRESSKRVVHLPEFDPSTFDIYHLWLFTGRLRTKPDPARNKEEWAQHLPQIGLTLEIYALEAEMLTLHKTSYLGHYLLDTAFSDSVNDAIVPCVMDLKSHGLSFPIRFGPSFYQVIPEGSTTRSLISDLAVRDLTLTDVVYRRVPPTDGKLTQAHAEFALDVLSVAFIHSVPCLAMTPPVQGWDTSCRYHSHGKDKPCYRKEAEMYVTDLTQSQD